LIAGGELPAKVLSIPEMVLFMSAGFPAVIVLTAKKNNPTAKCGGEI
jgi:hypothetical protein